MKKINISGPKDELAVVIDALKSTNAFELSSLKKANKENETSIMKNSLNTHITKVRGALAFIRKCINETVILEAHNQKKKEIAPEYFDQDYKKLKGMFGQTLEMTYDDFKKISAREGDMLRLIEEIDNASNKIGELKAQTNKNQRIIDELKPYINLPVSFNLLHDMQSVFILTGIIPKDSLLNFKNNFDLSKIIIEEFESGKNNLCIVCIGHYDDYAMINAICDYNFERCKFNYALTARDKTTELEEQLITDNAEILKLQKIGCTSPEILKDLRHYCDYLYNELETEEVLNYTLKTKDNYYLSGWIVAKQAETIEALIKKVSAKVIIDIKDANASDSPPTLVKNNKLIAPYESITNLYSAPSTRDLDPNVFVAFFYFLFFGIMIGDIGYGIIVFVVSLVILIWFKPQKGTKSLIAIICMGGISAMLWGIFFGSFFGLTKMGADGTETSLLPAVIDPINDSLNFLIFSLALGVVQIVFGLMLKLYHLCKQKRVFDAICDAGFRITLFIGLIMFALATFLIDVPIVSTIGIYIAITSVVLIFLTAGRKNKGFGKFTGGFGGVYSLVNYFSDILSYARLFGLGLVGAVIAMVANTMGALLFGLPIIGYVLGVIVMVFFHVFNLAIGLLSAYVHNARLQFVEFFGKFYEGGGRDFAPLGSKSTKYIKIKSVLNKEEK